MTVETIDGPPTRSLLPLVMHDVLVALHVR